MQLLVDTSSIIVSVGPSPQRTAHLCPVVRLQSRNLVVHAHGLKCVAKAAIAPSPTTIIDTVPYPTDYTYVPYLTSTISFLIHQGTPSVGLQVLITISQCHKRVTAISGRK